jgi:hypothetical protein
MRVEYLDASLPTGSIIRFFDFSPPELDGLIAEFVELAESRVGTSVQLAPHDSITTLNVPLVTAGVAKIDRGATLSGTSIQWWLTPAGWLDAADRARALDPSSANEFQWLDQSGPISVLLSVSGQW